MTPDRLTYRNAQGQACARIVLHDPNFDAPVEVEYTGPVANKLAELEDKQEKEKLNRTIIRKEM